ncbi:hypothetical protein [Phenylobacterium sp.]|nr:hypothetical protein [Phenylobacterium sp.]
MAKGQKKSNREVRKPKQAKAKAAPTSSATMGSVDKAKASSFGGKR